MVESSSFPSRESTLTAKRNRRRLQMDALVMSSEQKWIEISSEDQHKQQTKTLWINPPASNTSTQSTNNTQKLVHDQLIEVQLVQHQMDESEEVDVEA